jgi:hypothetical protein
MGSSDWLHRVITTFYYRILCALCDKECNRPHYKNQFICSSGDIFCVCVMSFRTQLGGVPRTFQHNPFNTAAHLLGISSSNFPFTVAVWRSYQPLVVFDYSSLSGNCICGNEQRPLCMPTRYSCVTHSDQQLEKRASVFRV